MPLDMAQCAREKLQASARDFWSSIRTFDDASKRREGDPPQATENAATMSLEKIENVFKLMFGSCTIGAVPQASPETEVTTSTHNVGRRSRSTNFVSGEHVYAQLFMDDQARASRAVDGLRERAASSPRSRASARFVPTTPNQQTLKAAPPTSRDLDISNDMSFDDGISAISAHTLEEMARVEDHKSNLYSKSNFTNQVETISYQKRNPATAPKTNTTKVIASPLNFTRGRSCGTMGTKGTKSTKSSQDSEFASVWKKEERKYWEDVVQQDKKSFAMSKALRKSTSKKGRRRSRCGSHSTKHDFTITTGTTASSSSYSNFSSSHFDKHSHPHEDVVQIDTRDILGSQDIFHREHPIASLDSSRIQKCMVVPYGSELGEI